jgi:hypothetical protein
MRAPEDADADAGAGEELEAWAQRIRWRGAVEEGGLVRRSTAQAENKEMEWWW